eukprot:7297425-Heterocapsa_arctica.AAC.1
MPAFGEGLGPKDVYGVAACVDDGDDGAADDVDDVDDAPMCAARRTSGEWCYERRARGGMLERASPGVRDLRQSLSWGIRERHATSIR